MSAHTRRRPADPDGASVIRQPLSPSLSDTAGPLSQFGVRMVQEAMAAAVPSTWLKRAATLEAARPRPGDFHGRATAEDVAERDRRLAESACAARLHAQFLMDNPDALAQTIAADVESLMLSAGAVSSHGDTA